MKPLNKVAAQEAQERIYSRFSKFPQSDKSRVDNLIYRRIGKKNITLLSGATETIMIVILRSDEFEYKGGMTMVERAELIKQHPNDMWEFQSNNPAEVEKQFNELIDRLEKE